MRVQNLDREQTLEAINLCNTRIGFNNSLNSFVKDYIESNGLVGFNGYYDEPSPDMVESLKGILQKQDWMDDSLKNDYLSSCGAIFGGMDSPASNAPLRQRLGLLRNHLEDIEHAADCREEDNEEFHLERDLGSNRMNIFFKSFPSDEARIIMRKHGFRWSPYLKAWTRQLTKNAEIALSKVKDEMGLQ